MLVAFLYTGALKHKTVDRLLAKKQDWASCPRTITKQYRPFRENKVSQHDWVTHIFFPWALPRCCTSSTKTADAPQAPTKGADVVSALTAAGTQKIYCGVITGRTELWSFVFWMANLSSLDSVCLRPVSALTCLPLFLEFCLASFRPCWPSW